ncbi:hypothetical protein P879_10304 [Paragonimus westermani]|uniref:Uncharacterized protein n=1 Tax=Paragonimus westermani TaxID=34504 RepID=A0A8T0D6M6_9TREM|nr:hypothetical protein P879_10304 [Paragonimus westermani]
MDRRSTKSSSGDDVEVGDSSTPRMIGFRLELPQEFCNFIPPVIPRREGPGFGRMCAIAGFMTNELGG